MIRGACLTAMELGIALLQTEDRDDSARWLRRLAVRRQRLEHAPDRPAYAQRPRVLTGAAAAKAALAVVPGISVVCARALLARFGSVQAVLQATVDQLITVPGIGSERARALEQTFRRQVALRLPRRRPPPELFPSPSIAEVSRPATRIGPLLRASGQMRLQ